MDNNWCIAKIFWVEFESFEGTQYDLMKYRVCVLKKQQKKQKQIVNYTENDEAA